MGAWGTGLYGADFASDLRGLVKSVLRLPVDESRILQILCEAEERAAHDPADDDHTTFWLVIADLLAKAGVACPEAFKTAIEIIDGGEDLKRQAARGMSGPKLEKHAAALVDLRGRLVNAPNVSKKRKTLDGPQPYLFDPGVIYALPCKGATCISPGRGRKTLDGSPWVHDGYRQFIVLERGRAFDYLAWYQAIVTLAAVPRKPRLDDANADLWWRLELPQMCSKQTFDALEIEAVGAPPIDLGRAYERFPKRRPGLAFLGWGGRAAAINDVELTNWFVQSIPDRTAAIAKGQPPQDGATIMRNLDDILTA
jgi:hypothetical protein